MLVFVRVARQLYIYGLTVTNIRTIIVQKFSNPVPTQYHFRFIAAKKFNFIRS